MQAGSLCGRASRSPTADGNPEYADLMMAVGEIVDRTHGSAGMVAYQPRSGGRLIPIHADEAFDVDEMERIADVLAVVPSGQDEASLQWQRCRGDKGQLLVIPMAPVPGQGRLVVVVRFDSAALGIRRIAEEAYAHGRSLYSALFRLWQAGRTLTLRSQAFESILDCTETGVILVELGGRVRFANHAARSILAKNNGLTCVQSTLRATNLADGVNLQAALSHLSVEGGQAADATTAPLLTFRRRDAPPLVALLLPANVPPSEPNDVVAIMHIVDPVFDAEKMLAPLCRLYGLSRVETSLVCRLASGDALSEAADMLHIREQTARGYLKQIFVKTGTKRQVQLIVLMLSSLMRIKRDTLQEAMTPVQLRGGTAHFA